CVDELLSTSGHLTVFPCSEHKTDIMTYIISYYITMRMRQHAALQNKDLKKKSSLLKKKSKLITNTNACACGMPHGVSRPARPVKSTATGSERKVVHENNTSVASVARFPSLRKLRLKT
ncbi:Uncharacterized protein FWK35_00034867, partial [Aphis craccivora]